ncbi:MAG TPA: aminotransferase class III-fold pyridoxal phosphate-dependent enzyme [Bacteroidales bacterium]|nr:aminotransferase class III-fold pyridoxal phosphate-dependent enzyme [Bacteroidales bacterium]HPS16760.1 aminotransferase class III-fold pyridoxal phosphate-dependent enzyme [Bacteroidales bacterium]
MINHETTNNNSVFFDLLFSSEINFSEKCPNNLAELVFKKNAERNEDSIIIISHDENNLVEVSLKRLRFIIYNLFNEFANKGIKPGDTVLLGNITGNNELFIALMFSALASYGVKVLLPMFMESGELYEWMQLTKSKVIILPEKDIFSLQGHENEKRTIKEIKETAVSKGINYYDFFNDFKIREFLYNDFSQVNPDVAIINEIIKITSHKTEALLITTSGSSGKSKLVIYEQGAFIKNCISWHQAGFYNEDKLGGRGFTPLFAHTMGVRAFMNALWTGTPVCLINTEWFIEKPETVSYLLRQMKLNHITGGPAVFNLMLEMMRRYPELKIEMQHSIKTVVFSGAPTNSKTALDVESALGLRINNAYGTTETQQVLSTVLLDDTKFKKNNSMGLLLPGVSIGLKEIEDEKNNYLMYIKSPFGMKGIFNHEDKNDEIPFGYFDTGDIVTLNEDNELVYVKRKSRDFFKDGFGVKIPLPAINNYYAELINIVKHIEYFPLKDIPGLTALIFIKDEKVKEGAVIENRIIKEYSGFISKINDNLFSLLEPFESRHRTIKRFALINETVPTTGKGTVSQYKIQTKYKEIIDKLVDVLSWDEAIENVINRTDFNNSFTYYNNPHIGGMLEALAADYTYHRSKKDSLFTFIKGKETEVLDMTGGYGTNLLGHNNDEIKNVANDFLNSDEIAISDQGSIQKYIGALAEKLNALTSEATGSDYTVLFGSTGTEAVEIAIHHAFFEWINNIEDLKRQQYQKYGGFPDSLVEEVWQSNLKVIDKTRVHIIALKNAFHGHTVGSRGMLGNNKKRNKFKNILGISAVFIDERSENWKTELEKKLENCKLCLEKVVPSDKGFVKQKFYISTVIAAIAEPIVGEGGIHITNTDFLDFLSGFDFPLIMDEIQCGLGRAGTFLASQGHKASYYLFAKSLGGNIEKISCILIDRKRYKKDFAEYYSSTFSNGGLAAKVALKTLKIIKNDNVPERAKTQGEKIVNELKKIQDEFPKVIEEISGRGLMLGIRFCDFSNDENFLLRILYNQKKLGLLLSAYLLKCHDIRILPTLSAPNTLRIEPSCYIDDNEIAKFIKSIETLCEIINNRNLYELLKPLMDGDMFEDNKGKMPESGFLYTAIDKPKKNAVKVAIVAHFVYPVNELRCLEKDLCKASDTGLRILFNRVQTLMEMEPFLIFSKNLFNGKIHFSFIAIPIDTCELERLNRQKKTKTIVAKIQKAVDMAGNMGAKVVSLGAYTSIVSNNGLALVEPKKTRIVTGNTLTAASCVKKILQEISFNKYFEKNKILAIVGAAGNIGSVIAESLLRSDIAFDKVYLIGRSKSKLEKVLMNFCEDTFIRSTENIEIATDLTPLSNCNIIIAATNTNDPIIFPHHLNNENAVIISDMSTPKAVSDEVYLMKNIIALQHASYIKLPGDNDFIISSHTPKGAVFCCAAEAILCGLSHYRQSLKGKLSVKEIEKIISLMNEYKLLEQKEN